MNAPVASKQAFFYRVLQEINLPHLPVEFSSFYGSSLRVASSFPFFSLPFEFLFHLTVSLWGKRANVSDGTDTFSRV